jgi:uncharacterized protein (TIGR02001 family)
VRPWRAATSFSAALLSKVLAAVTAAAQLGGSLTFSSQARLRGQPISDHRPVAELELLHDDASGFYIGGSAALVATRDEGLHALSFKQYAGFARRLSSATAIDVGIVHNGYTEYSGIAGGGSYTEAYVGIAGRHLSGRLFLSRDYFRKDGPTLYAEVNGNLDLARNWSLFAHAGWLARLRNHPDSRSGDATDWRIGVRRHLGPVDLEAACTGYVEDQAPDGRRDGEEGAVVIAVAFAF